MSAFLLRLDLNVRLALKQKAFGESLRRGKEVTMNELVVEYILEGLGEGGSSIREKDVRKGEGEVPLTAKNSKRKRGGGSAAPKEEKPTLDKPAAVGGDEVLPYK